MRPLVLQFQAGSIPGTKCHGSLRDTRQQTMYARLRILIPDVPGRECSLELVICLLAPLQPFEGAQGEA